MYRLHTRGPASACIHFLRDSEVTPQLIRRMLRRHHAMVAQAFWQFHCPECGFGSTEHGHLLTAHEIHCIVCLEEEGREVRLHRWEVIEVEQLAT